jgi:hypothetical protein
MFKAKSVKLFIPLPLNINKITWKKRRKPKQVTFLAFCYSCFQKLEKFRNTDKNKRKCSRKRGLAYSDV